MASIERLTKRVKKMEEWIENNTDMGGPMGLLETMSYLIHERRSAQQHAEQLQHGMQQLRSYTFEFLKNNDMAEKWDEYIAEKENAVQEQQAEEVPLQEETESGEETVEAPKEEIKD